MSCEGKNHAGLMTRQDVADVAGVSINTVDAWIRYGHLDPVKVYGLKAQDVKALLEARSAGLPPFKYRRFGGNVNQGKPKK